MKILMASSYFASHSGGLEIVAGMLFQEFAAMGQEIVWMAGDITPPPEPTGQGRTVSLRIWNFVEDKTGIPFPIPSVGAVKTILREVRKVDVVVLHDCLYLSNMVAFLVAKWRGVPTVVIQHVGFIPYRSMLPNLLLRLGNALATRPMLSRASQVVFIGDVTRKYFEGVRYRRAPRLIFNGVDTEMFRPLESPETVEDLRREYGLPESGTVVLFVGRFVEKKGMRALRHMVAMRPGWTWAFAGWGPMEPREWNLDNVKVFTGLRGDSLAPLYRCCDALVLPSIGEGFPLVIQEALASGLPVVCGEDTLSTDRKMAQFVRTAAIYPGDDERTARAFVAAITARSEQSSAGCRDFAAARYSWRNAALEYLKLAEGLSGHATASGLSERQTAQGERT